ncbi:MAG TPA: hypothetical protein VF310_17660, partial [Vicinamibacteria bacterium]
MANDNENVTRRDFTKHSLLALFAGVTVTLSGCGDDEPDGPTPVDKAGTISNNHGHVATITAARQTTGAAFDLDIMGTATHTHTVSLTAAQVVQVRNGTQLVVTSTTTNSHQHTVTFN